MKILLTVAGLDKVEFESHCDSVEYIIKDAEESEKEFLERVFKAAKGKYTVLCTPKFTPADVESLVNIIDKNTADLVCFTNEAAVKTSIYKSAAKNCDDIFSCRLSAVINCKTLLKTVYTPFMFFRGTGKFREENISGLLNSAEAFGKVKAKLSKDIYTYAFNLLLDRLVSYYMYAMLAIRDGDMQAEELINFDGKLKAEIVLYLALEKRFTAAKLQKLREKQFKISGFKAKKFRKLLG